MFAVIQIKGHQYKVAEGDTIKVDTIAAKEGDMVEFDEVLLLVESDEKIDIGTPYVEAVVTCKVKQHGRHDKVRVVKVLKRKRYIRTHGHRQAFSEIEIIKIAKGKKKVVVAKKDVDEVKGAEVKKTPQPTPVKEKKEVNKKESESKKKTEAPKKETVKKASEKKEK